MAQGKSLPLAAEDYLLVRHQPGQADTMDGYALMDDATGGVAFRSRRFR